MINLEKLESLAKIKLLSNEEKTEAARYFDFWTEKFDMLAEINTNNTEPLISVFSLENIMREDTAYKIFDREVLLENAPEQHDGYFVVPRILE